MDLEQRGADPEAMVGPPLLREEEPGSRPRRGWRSRRSLLGTHEVSSSTAGTACWFNRHDERCRAHTRRGPSRPSSLRVCLALSSQHTIASSHLNFCPRPLEPETTVEEPRRPYRGFSLSRVFGLSIGDLKVSRPGLEPAAFSVRSHSPSGTRADTEVQGRTKPRLYQE
jgi:hypothetical protein